MGNQFDRYEYEAKDIHHECGYVRGSFGCIDECGDNPAPLLCDNCGTAMAFHGALAECYLQPVEGGNVEDES